jgi:hypothetical protein
MTHATSPSQWLIAEFDATWADEIDTGSYDPALDEWTHPVFVAPMIKLKSLMDAGEPMRVTQADYADSLRRWL